MELDILEEEIVYTQIVLRRLWNRSSTDPVPPLTPIPPICVVFKRRPPVLVKTAETISQVHKKKKKEKIKNTNPRIKSNGCLFYDNFYLLKHFSLSHVDYNCSNMNGVRNLLAGQFSTSLSIQIPLSLCLQLRTANFAIMNGRQAKDLGFAWWPYLSVSNDKIFYVMTLNRSHGQFASVRYMWAEFRQNPRLFQLRPNKF